MTTKEGFTRDSFSKHQIGLSTHAALTRVGGRTYGQITSLEQTHQAIYHEYDQTKKHSISDYYCTEIEAKTSNQ